MRQVVHMGFLVRRGKAGPQTMLGSVLLPESNKHPAELRKMVIPGGKSAEAIYRWKATPYSALEGSWAAFQRANSWAAK